eukprot:COSAG02_NODE_728_length_17995_cov_52.042244_2_plen_122_part_00
MACGHTIHYRRLQETTGDYRRLQEIKSSQVDQAPSCSRYVDPDVFEEITRLAGDPMPAEIPADRDALLKAFQTVTRIVQVAQVEALNHPTEDEIDTLEILPIKFSNGQNQCRPYNNTAQYF